MTSEVKVLWVQEGMLKDLTDSKEVRASLSFKTYLLKRAICAKGKKMLYQRDTNHSSPRPYLPF